MSKNRYCQKYISFFVFVLIFSFILQKPAFAASSGNYGRWLKDSDTSTVYGSTVTVSDDSVAAADNKHNFIDESIGWFFLYEYQKAVEWWGKGFSTSTSNLVPVILGRVATNDADSPYQFSLAKTNTYGKYGALIFSILRAIILSFFGLYFFYLLLKQSATTRTGKGVSLFKDEILNFVFLFLLLAIFPNLIDVSIFVRDSILKILSDTLLSNVTGAMSTSGTLSSIFYDKLKSDLCAINGLMLWGSILLSVYFIVIYISVAFTMTIAFAMFPAIAFLALKNKNLLSSWISVFLGSLATPVIDFLLLAIALLIPTSVAPLKLLACWCIIPCRGLVRSMTGTDSGKKSEMIGLGSLAGAMMLGRMALSAVTKKPLPSPKSDINKAKEHEALDAADQETLGLGDTTTGIIQDPSLSMKRSLPSPDDMNASEIPITEKGATPFSVFATNGKEPKDPVEKAPSTKSVVDELNRSKRKSVQEPNGTGDDLLEEESHTPITDSSLSNDVDSEQKLNTFGSEPSDTFQGNEADVSISPSIDANLKHNDTTKLGADGSMVDSEIGISSDMSALQSETSMEGSVVSNDMNTLDGSFKEGTHNIQPSTRMENLVKMEQASKSINKLREQSATASVQNAHIQSDIKSTKAGAQQEINKINSKIADFNIKKGNSIPQSDEWKDANNQINLLNKRKADITSERDAHVRAQEVKLQTNNEAIGHINKEISAYQNDVADAKNMEANYAFQAASNGGSSRQYTSPEALSNDMAKQQRILEVKKKFINAQNFESPEYANVLSHKEMAQFYRQRAVATRAANIGKVAGAVAVGSTAAAAMTFFGPSAMVTGGIAGSSVGNLVGDRIGREVGNIPAAAKAVQDFTNEHIVPAVNLPHGDSKQSNISYEMQSEYARAKKTEPYYQTPSNYQGQNFVPTGEIDWGSIPRSTDTKKEPQIDFSTLYTKGAEEAKSKYSTLFENIQDMNNDTRSNIERQVSICMGNMNDYFANYQYYKNGGTTGYDSTMGPRFYENINAQIMMIKTVFENNGVRTLNSKKVLELVQNDIRTKYPEYYEQIDWNSSQIHC